MTTRTRLRSVRVRAAVASAACAVALVASLGMAVPSSSASEATFCKTLLTYHATVPTTITVASYHAWARAEVPFFSALAAIAPDAAARTVLNEIVTILKYYESQASLNAIKAYWLSHHNEWVKDTKALAADLEACAKTLL